MITQEIATLRETLAGFARPVSPVKTRNPVAASLEPDA